MFADVLYDLTLSKEEQLQLLYEKSSNFYIKNLIFSFNLKDQIFSLSAGVEPRKQIKRCLPCDFAFTKKEQMIMCTFCGLSACQDCTKKTRIYPNCIKDPISQKQELRGIICKLCDRKFFIREMCDRTMKKIETFSNMINSQCESV